MFLTMRVVDLKLALRIFRSIATILFLAFVGPAYAGYYDVTYSTSGQTTLSNSTTSYSYPYGVTTYGVSGGGTISGQQPRVSCSGSITANFTWVPSNPSDLPPKVAILKEMSGASWESEYGDINATGSGTDGMGHPVGDLGTYGYANGTRYQVIPNPGASWSAPAISPSVSAQQNQYKLTGQVGYNAGLYGVWIDTTYTQNDGGLIYAEASRPTQAYITCPLPNVSFSNHQWNASGRFVKGYSPSTPSAHAVYMSAPDWTVAQPKWHYYDRGASTITCSVTLQTTDGLLNQSVSTSKDLGVEKVTVGGTTNYSQRTNDNGWMIYTATNPAVTDIGGNQVGMVYAVTNGASSVAPHFPPGGALADAQLLNAYWTMNFTTLSTNGEFWLDNGFPYGSPGSIQYFSGQTYAIMDGSDSPAAGGLNVIVQTSFDMSLLYKASVSGSIYIPASHFVWTWNAGIGGTNGQPNGGGLIQSIMFPEWDHVFNNVGGGGGEGPIEPEGKRMGGLKEAR